MNRRQFLGQSAAAAAGFWIAGRQVGFGQDNQIVRGHVDSVQPHRGLEHIFVVDPDHERGRPQLARRQRTRSSDQSQADDADLLKNGNLPLDRLPGLDDGEFHDISDCRLLTAD